MTRVRHTRAHNGAHRPSALDANRAAVRKKKPYKVVLEAVTQEKRKLHSILSYASNAPQGFGFIPAGHPEFTEWCKEQCRQRNLDVHVVSAKPKNKAHADPDKISHHVHRIGHHFPLEIIRLACNKFNYTFDEEHGLRQGGNANAVRWMEKEVENYTSRLALQTGGRPATEKETKDHISGAVRELFPKIPEADLSSIVNHAFQEGTNRVGNAKELSLARRVQLAVVAHIRHTYTDYDKILKTGTWLEARSKVEHVSLAKLKEWRDETGEDSNELEDTFREVIVLDDDEASSDDETYSSANEREPSMEIVSSRATARELQPEKFMDRAPMDMGSRRRAPRTIFVRPGQPFPPAHLLGGPQQTYPAPQLAPLPTRPPPPATLAEPRPHVRVDPVYLAHSTPMDSRRRPAASQSIPIPPHSMQIRGEDGRLYNLEPIEEMHGPIRIPISSGMQREYRHAYDTHVQSPQRIAFEGNRQSRASAAPVSRRASEQDIALPSVEHDAENLASPRRVADPQHTIRQGHTSMSMGYGELQSPKRKDLVSTHNTEPAYYEPVAKRMRPMYDGHEAYQRPGPSHSVLPRQKYEYEPTELRHRPRAQPPQEVIDLTYSPLRPSNGRDRDAYLPVHTYPAARPYSHSHNPAPTRVSPRRDTGGVYYQPNGESSRAYVPEQDRMFERRPRPPNDYVLMREEQRPLTHVDGQSGRYVRNGMDHGGYNLH